VISVATLMETHYYVTLGLILQRLALANGEDR
jgi:hypothetical protein